MNKKNETTFIVSGLKCDNKDCDYKNDSIQFKDYKRYINKGCPKCGMILLTKKEYRLCKFLIVATKLINKFFPGKEKDEMKTVTFNLIDQERFEK